MESLEGLVFSVSHTTRAPRSDEVDGIHYHFVGKERFVAMRDQEPSGFLEWAEVHGNLYGTSRDEVEKQQKDGRDVILDIDVQGGEQVRSQTCPVTVFIAPPTLEELATRLHRRGTEDEQTISLRLKNAEEEMQAADVYDYLIVNDKLDEAVDALRSIIIAERSRRRRTVAGQRVRLVL